MTNVEANNRIQKARKILFDETPADRVLDTYVAPDFVEFICEAGGDPMRIRVYNDGRVYEK